MSTASVHIDLIQGVYSGAARCYRLSPPFQDPNDDRFSYEYVTVVVQPGRPRHQLPELLIFAADVATGAPLGPSMKKLPGSGTLHFWPTDPDHGWLYGLMQLGVTHLVEVVPDGE